MTAKCSATVHILGYRVRRPEPLEEALQWVRERRKARNGLILHRLQELGLEMEIEDIEQEAGGQVIARPHFASALVKKGYAANTASAFARYLAEGAPAYIERESYTPVECLQILRAADALPVLAHPWLTGWEQQELGEFLEEMKQYGLWGLECISSHGGTETAFEYLRMAERHALFPTAGSDFHGSRRPDAVLGVSVSEAFLPWARLGVKL